MVLRSIARFFFRSRLSWMTQEIISLLGNILIKFLEYFLWSDTLFNVCLSLLSPLTTTTSTNAHFIRSLIIAIPKTHMRNVLTALIRVLTKCRLQSDFSITDSYVKHWVWISLISKLIFNVMSCFRAFLNTDDVLSLARVIRDCFLIRCKSVHKVVFLVETGCTYS